MCLDIFNGGTTNNQPHLAPCANLTGQFWHITADGSRVRLTTNFEAMECVLIFSMADPTTINQIKALWEIVRPVVAIITDK